MRTEHKRKCIRCGRIFYTTDTREGKGRCCSLSCSAGLSSLNRDQSGEQNNNWRGGSDNTSRKRRYREKNPDKHFAHIALRNAIRRREIFPRPCEKCGFLFTEGHHCDYSKPLDVKWLCRKHHMEAHGGRLDNGL